MLPTCAILWRIPVSAPPSVASSNQDIMRAKRGCISTLRAAGFALKGRGGVHTEAVCPALLSHHTLKLPCVTHRRDLLCLHVSHHPSLPPPTLLPSFSPMPAPLQKLGTPWEQLQPGFHCSSSRDTPPALQPYEEAVTIVCACLYVCSCVCHFSTQAQDSLFIKPVNAESKSMLSNSHMRLPT